MKVKKSTRSKVSTACVNCRKRKIKCTGKYPCTNCISYDCTCVFLKKHLPQKEDSSQSLPTTAVAPPSSHANVEASADVQHLDTAIKLDNQYYFKLMNDLIQTPSLRVRRMLLILPIILLMIIIFSLKMIPNIKINWLRIKIF